LGIFSIILGKMRFANVQGTLTNPSPPFMEDMKLVTNDEEESAMTSQTFQLVIHTGPNPGKVFTLSKSEIVIGRDINLDVVINTAEVSRRHARLYLEGGVYVVEDLGSTNGTFINHQRLTTPVTLQSGDRIMLGEAATLVYEASQLDPNATMISPSSGQASVPPPRPASVAPQQMTPPPQAYAGQVPADPAAQPQAGMPYAPTVPRRRGGISWLWAGVGCVVILLCIMVVGLLIFDTLNLYCVPPFDILNPLYQMIGGSCY
jgi:pSer/pThr/pTyr-binding forkhead associated (FHA) protein